MMKNLLRHLSRLLLPIALLLGLLLVFYGSRLLNKSENSVDKQRFQTVAYCNTYKGCQSRVGNGSIMLNILPASMPTGQPLAIRAEVSGLAAEKVSMEFVGRDMPMGLMPFNLQKQSGHFADTDLYTGTGNITFCTTDRNMVWIARLKMETREAVYNVLFELDPLEANSQQIAILP
ncbi:hypothetical protein ACTL6P_06760 [Endozoicomonas acroporae]|uniref:hypothetical protein n=1 Tax=Endozoicomonas acroporae TaxID=1701104 RepID=UPI0011AFB085|nr:hypothetical protein [Endozoicomonas acroporae]